MVASRARVEGDARPVLGGASRGLVDAAVVAGYLGVERGWVYEHSDELAVRRLGVGPRARLRFSLEEVDRVLTGCTAGRKSEAPEPVPSVSSRRRRQTSSGTSVELLPIRGPIVSREGS
jgi:hypothetical protein